MRREFFRHAWWLMCWLALPAWALTDERAETRPEIVLSATDFPGKHTYSQHPYSELVGAALQQLGYSLRVVHAPGLRSLVMANNGVVDGELVRVRDVSGEFPNLIQVPEPLNKATPLVLVCARSRAPENGSWHEVKADSVVAIKGLVVMAFLPERFARLPQIQAQNYRQSMQLLIANRADLALIPLTYLTNPDVADLADQVQALQPEVAQLQGYVHLHKRHADLVQPLAAAMARVKAARDLRDSVGK